MEEAIDANSAALLMRFFKETKTQSKIDVLIQDLHPVAYAINTHQETVDPQLLRVLISYSTLPSLMRIDQDGDSIMSFLVIVPDDNELYTILKTLRRSGYDFGRVYGPKNFSDLDIYLSTCILDKRALNTRILHMLSTKYVLTHNKDYILFLTTLLPLNDMKLVMNEFKHHHVDITSSKELITNIIKKSPKDSVLEKLQYVESLGVKPDSNLFDHVCSWGVLDLSVFQSVLQFLSKYIKPSPKQVSKCLLDIVMYNPTPSLDLVKTLCDMGNNSCFILFVFIFYIMKLI